MNMLRSVAAAAAATKTNDECDISESTLLQN